MSTSSLQSGRVANAAAAAAILFTVAWIVLGRISPGFTLFGTHIAPYNWVAQPVSGLGLGYTADWMNAVFVLTGALLAIGIIGILANVAGVSRGERIGLGAVLLLSPVGTALCGVFDLEHFMLHMGGFLLAMGAPVVGFFLLGRKLSRQRAFAGVGRFLIVAACVTLVLLMVSLWIFDPAASGRGLGTAGLLQRVLITEVLGVFAVLGWLSRPSRYLR